MAIDGTGSSWHCEAARGFPALEGDSAALHDAIHSGNAPEVSRILENADPSVHNCLPLRCAVELGHLAVVDCLLSDSRVNPACGALTIASAKGHLSVVDRLLADPRVDPSIGDSEPLVFACRDGHLPVVERLLSDPRVDVCQKALTSALLYDHDAVVRRLLCDPRVDPAAERNRLFKAACSFDRLAVMQLLLCDPRVDVALPDCGAEAFRQAASRNCARVIEALLRDPRIDPSVSLDLPSAGRDVQLVVATTPYALRRCLEGHDLLYPVDTADIVSLALQHCMRRKMYVFAARKRAFEED